MPCKGLKMGSFHFFVHAKWWGSFLEKRNFDLFLTHFWSQSSPFSWRFVTLEGPKWLVVGSKWAHFTY